MAGQGREFESRVALVTGGSRGIGLAVCLALAYEGADIALNGHVISTPPDMGQRPDPAALAWRNEHCYRG